MGFGKKLKALREDKNLTQSELAQILGITLKTVSNYETKDAQSMAGLFAGGDLPDEDKDALFEAIQQAYWKAKLENKKYGRRKKGEV